MTRYFEGESVAQITQDMGPTRTQVAYYLKSLGLTVRSPKFYATKYSETDTHRECRGCKKVKPIDDFHKSNRMAGRQNRCYLCVKEYGAKRLRGVAANKDQSLRYMYGIT